MSDASQIDVYAAIRRPQPLGEVIDHSLLSTSVAEIDSKHNRYDFTGKTVILFRPMKDAVDLEQKITRDFLSFFYERRRAANGAATSKS